MEGVDNENDRFSSHKDKSRGKKLYIQSKHLGTEKYTVQSRTLYSTLKACKEFGGIEKIKNIINLKNKFGERDLKELNQQKKQCLKDFKRKKIHLSKKEINRFENYLTEYQFTNRKEQVRKVIKVLTRVDKNLQNYEEYESIGDNDLHSNTVVNAISKLEDSNYQRQNIISKLIKRNHKLRKDFCPYNMDELRSNMETFLLSLTGIKNDLEVSLKNVINVRTRFQTSGNEYLEKIRRIIEVDFPKIVNFSVTLKKQLEIEKNNQRKILELLDDKTELIRKNKSLKEKLELISGKLGGSYDQLRKSKEYIKKMKMKIDTLRDTRNELREINLNLKKELSNVKQLARENKTVYKEFFMEKYTSKINLLEKENEDMQKKVVEYQKNEGKKNNNRNRSRIAIEQSKSNGTEIDEEKIREEERKKIMERKNSEDEKQKIMKERKFEEEQKKYEDVELNRKKRQVKRSKSVKNVKSIANKSKGNVGRLRKTRSKSTIERKNVDTIQKKKKTSSRVSLRDKNKEKISKMNDSQNLKKKVGVKNKDGETYSVRRRSNGSNSTKPETRVSFKEKVDGTKESDVGKPNRIEKDQIQEEEYEIEKIDKQLERINKKRENTPKKKSRRKKKKSKKNMKKYVKPKRKKKYEDKTTNKISNEKNTKKQLLKKEDGVMTNAKEAKKKETVREPLRESAERRKDEFTKKQNSKDNITERRRNQLQNKKIGSKKNVGETKIKSSFSMIIKNDETKYEYDGNVKNIEKKTESVLTRENQEHMEKSTLLIQKDACDNEKVCGGRRQITWENRLRKGEYGGSDDYIKKKERKNQRDDSRPKSGERKRLNRPRSRKKTPPSISKSRIPLIKKTSFASGRNGNEKTLDNVKKVCSKTISPRIITGLTTPGSRPTTSQVDTLKLPEIITKKKVHLSPRKKVESHSHFDNIFKPKPQVKKKN